jgi:cation transport ATPase
VVIVSQDHKCCEVNHSEHDQFVEQTERWDKLGVTLSGLCAIHCLATPLLALSAPFLGEIFEQPWVHLMMALFVVPVGVFAFYRGYHHHKKKYIVALGLIGLVLIGIGLASPILEISMYEHDVFTISGSALLIVSHILNRRACLCHSH